MSLRSWLRRRHDEVLFSIPEGPARLDLPRSQDEAVVHPSIRAQSPFSGIFRDSFQEFVPVGQASFRDDHALAFLALLSKLAIKLEKVRLESS
jgi:hypothetical protein